MFEFMSNPEKKNVTKNALVYYLCSLKYSQLTYVECQSFPYTESLSERYCDVCSVIVTDGCQSTYSHRCTIGQCFGDVTHDLGVNDAHYLLKSDITIDTVIAIIVECYIWMAYRRRYVRRMLMNCNWRIRFFLRNGEFTIFLSWDTCPFY